MALLIEKNVDVLGDISLSQLYVRLTVGYGPGGSSLVIIANPYSSKVAYGLSSITNTFYVEGIPHDQEIAYDREVDGIDLLTFAHDKTKEFLSTDVMKDIPVLDPSTGEPTYDPSTGLPITEEVLDIPKFAMDSSISIVDISIG